MEMEPKSWARAQEIIRRYAQNQALKADLVEAQRTRQCYEFHVRGAEKTNTETFKTVSRKTKKKI